MGFVPHPEIPLGTIRVMDMLVLLFVGATWEVLMKAILMTKKMKPRSVKDREIKLKLLEKQVNDSRAKGPQAFVETSKLERQQLAEEKALAAIAEVRQADIAQWEKIASRINMFMSLVVFFVYYGIPLLEFSGERMSEKTSQILTQEEAHDLATRNLQGFLFPISYVGVGVRVSKWGLPSPQSNIGALVVFWSAQTTVSLLMEAVEFIFLA